MKILATTESHNAARVTLTSGWGELSRSTSGRPHFFLEGHGGTACGLKGEPYAGELRHVNSFINRLALCAKCRRSRLSMVYEDGTPYHR